MNLKSIGGFLAIAGIASIVLHFLDMNLKLLMWIDMWGPAVGWVIRAGLIIGGGILWFVGRGGDGE